MNSTVSWDMMLCILLEITMHYGGTSVNYYQITWSHILGFCILYEGRCDAVFGIPLFGPLGPGVIFICQCRLWSCSNDTVVQFLAGTEIFCFLSVFTLALGSTQLHIQR